MGYIIINDEKDGGTMRSNMRRTMARYGENYRHYETMPMMRQHHDDEYRRGYETGFRHGWEDHEDESEEHYRRMRDSRGRFI